MKNPNSHFLSIFSLARLVLASGLFALAACSSVTCKQPAGDTAAHLDAEKWNGSWATQDGHTVVICVKDQDKGQLELGWLDVKDGAIRFEKLSVQIASAGGWLWASARESHDKNYTVLRISDASDQQILGWPMNSEALIPHLKQGELKGDVLKNDKGQPTKDILLDSLHDADLEAIKKGQYGEAFDWSKPMVLLHRLKD